MFIDQDCAWKFIDDSYVKAYQHSARATDKKSQAIEKNRAENTTKIHPAVNSYGLPVSSLKLSLEKLMIVLWPQLDCQVAGCADNCCR